MKTIGIDPGAKGAIAFESTYGLPNIHPMPMDGKNVCLETVKDLCRHYALSETRGAGDSQFKCWTAWIEESLEVGYWPAKPDCPVCHGRGKVPIAQRFSATPTTTICVCRRRQGLHATARLVGNARLVEGCLIGMDIPVMRIAPAKWQSVAFDVPRRKGKQDSKALSIAAAKRHYPGICLRRTSRCQVNDHNYADAVNMLWVGMRCTPK